LVRKNTVQRNPIGSTSEALQRQRSRQSLRRHIMDCEQSGLEMNTENLLEYNPKLAEISHTTRVAYAKFMTTKIKKEIRFEDDKIEIENEMVRARESKAFNAFKSKTILKRPAAEVVQDPAVQEAAGFRVTSPIVEDPNEDIQTPDRPLTPENIIDEPISETSPPLPTSSPSPIAPKSPKTDSPIVKLRSASVASSTTDQPPTITTSETISETAEDDNVRTKDKPLPSPSRLTVPSNENRATSPTMSMTGDKGKSKITGKTLTGWI